MNPKKQKEKDRRRARKLAEQAWEAASADNLDLAVKIIRRATETQPDNPVLWNDQGVLLARKGDEQAAEASFRAALSLAPDYAESYAHLAAIRIRQGRLTEAVTLQTRALHYAPDNPSYTERLQAYQALAGQEVEAPASITPPVIAQAQGEDRILAELTERLAVLDWHNLAKRLTRDGCLLLAELLDATTCTRLCAMFDDEPRFVRSVVMDAPNFGRGVYRYFRAPLAGLVDDVRRAVYPHAARIANQWQELLGKTDRFPEEWEEFRALCHAAGQSTPTPILLKYEAGGFNALHRDLRGSLYFPIQLAVVLSPRASDDDPAAEGFRGGEFLFCDVPERQRSKRVVLSAGLGDAVLFCTRDRLTTVGGVHGLQPVMHGVTPITAGTRFVLGVPFHEYR